MFKMKTTRPTIYKMKPVFGQVLPGEKFSVRLVYKGIKVGDRIPLNDRFTIVVATTSQAGEQPAPGENLIASAEMKKKQIDVLFTGVNDKESKGDVVGPVVAVDKDSVPTATIVPKKLQQLWVDAPEDRDWIRKLFMREDRYMETAEDEPRNKPKVKPKPASEIEDLEARKMIKEEPRGYLDGYYEGYRLGLNECKQANEGDALKFALNRMSKQEDTPRTRAYKCGLIEGYSRAKMLREGRSSTFATPMKSQPVRLIDKPSEKEGGLTNGRNVSARTPGGSQAILIDPLQRRDIIHISRTGEKKFIVVMYRDPKVPVHLISRSGDDTDSEGTERQKKK